MFNFLKSYKEYKDKKLKSKQEREWIINYYKDKKVCLNCVFLERVLIDGEHISYYMLRCGEYAGGIKTEIDDIYCTCTKFKGKPKILEIENDEGLFDEN